MKNVKTYDNFSEKNKTVVLNYEDFMVNEFWGINTAVKNLYNKVTTTGKQRDLKQQNKTEEEDISVPMTNVNRMAAKKPEAGFVKKTATNVGQKLGRELTGTNAFIDTKSGKISAMDVILSKEDFQKVIDLWKKGNKDGAADVLQAYALRERDAQFNIAVGLMLSASIAGLKSLKSKIIPKINPQQIDDAKKASSDWAKSLGGGKGGDEYGKDFVRDTSGAVKGAGKAVKKATDLGADVTHIPPDGGVYKLPSRVADHIDMSKVNDIISKQGTDFVVNTASKAGKKIAKLNNLLNLDPSQVTKKTLDKAETIVQNLKDQGILNPGPIDKLDAMRKIIRGAGETATNVADIAAKGHAGLAQAGVQ